MCLEFILHNIVGRLLAINLLIFKDLTHDMLSLCSSFCINKMFLQCRLRGKIDSNGVFAAFLEERLKMGVNFILSAEVIRTSALDSLSKSSSFLSALISL